MRLCGYAVMRLYGWVVSMAAIISMASMVRQPHGRNVNLQKPYHETKTVQPHNRTTVRNRKMLLKLKILFSCCRIFFI